MNESIIIKHNDSDKYISILPIYKSSGHKNQTNTLSLLFESNMTGDDAFLLMNGLDVNWI